MATTDNSESTSSDKSNNDNWHKPHEGLLTDGHHLSLPAHLQSSHHAYRPNSHQLSVIFLILVSVGAGFLGGWWGGDAHNNSDSSIITSGKQTVISSQSQDIENIAKIVGQSVVSVDVTSQGSSAGFGLFGPGGASGQPQEDAGTGIILSANGLIITNRHVIPAGTTSVSVTLSDGTSFNNVQVIGRTNDNSSLDVAFLKIQNLNGKKLVPATLGDSSQMKVGDAVIAIGNALGQFQNTVTTGILSGYGRSVQASDSTGTSSENLDDLFQTDAAINEGNSGGPLVNLSGQVIGINTAIASGSENIGFAIPINDVIGLIKGVEQSGTLQQPYLGVLYIPITSDLAQQYNLSVNNGAWVPPTGVTGQASVVSGGPADKAGVKAGDIIMAINGQQINQTTSLPSIIDQQKVGNTVTLTINRNGKTLTVKATLAAEPTSTSSTNG